MVAGRDRPRWAEASKFKIPEGYLDIQLVGHLSETDAVQYLERAGVVDAEIRQCLVEYARVASDQIHPLYLGLCADVALAASEKGTTLTPEDFRIAPQTADKGTELMNRLLRYVDAEVGYAVRALSACRAFDQEIYFKLGEALNFQATEPAFTVLTRFSFVWLAEQRGEGWYRIHDLLRRLARERAPDDALTHNNRGIALQRLGELQARLSQHREAVSSYTKAIAAFDEALGRAPDDVYAYNNKGNVFLRLGQLQAELSRHKEAVSSYTKAIAAFDEALGRAPDDVYAYNNKGNAFLRLGQLQAELLQHKKAVESYRQAIVTYNEALGCAPDLVQAHNNKGLAFASLGNLQVELSQHEEAVESYKKAIAVYDEALRRAPDDVVTHKNKGLTLLSLGGLQFKLLQREKAIESLQVALVEFSQSLEIAPGDRRIRDLKDRVQGMINELRGR